MLEKLRSKWRTDGDTATATRTTVQTPPAAPPSSVETAVQASAPAPAIEGSEKVRLNAVAQTTNDQQLRRAALHDDSSAVREAAARRYASLLPDTPDTETLIDAMFATAEQRQLRIAVAAHHPVATVRNRVLARTDNEVDQVDIATATRYRDTRRTAVDSLKSLEAFAACYQGIKTRDKAIARELKTKLDASRERQQQITEREAETQKLLDSMEKLAASVWSPSYANRFGYLAAAWREQSSGSAEQNAAFTAAEHTAQATIDSNRSKVDAEQTRVEVIASLRNHNAELIATPLAQLPERLPLAQAGIADARQRWESIADVSPIDSEAVAEYSARAKRLSTTIDQARATTDAAAVFTGDDSTSPLPPAAIEKKLPALQSLIAAGNNAEFTQTLPQIVESLQHQLNTHQEEQKKLRQSIHKQFGALHGAINSKKWGPAKSIHERLTRKISRLEAKQRKPQQEKLEQLSERLRELGDWKEFATRHKLEELCAQMENIPQLGLNPRDQADRIKQLQNSWKLMGASPAQHDLWPRFKTAADTAFAPCAEFFAKQRERKDATLQQREQICDMLQEYLEKSDWQNPDWRKVEKTLHTARRTWRNVRIFDRKKARAQEQRFNELMDALYEKLNPIYAASVAEKRDLIDKIKELGEGDINQHCMNQVKRLQAVWKRGGIIRHKDDQLLWKEFNEACSAIYNTHRQHQREQYQSSIEHVTRARAIIGALRNAAKQNRAPDDKEIQQLHDEFQSLPEFPEKDARYLLRDFTRANDALDNLRQRTSNSSRAAELQRLQRQAALCEQLESLAGSPVADAAVEIEELMTQWEDGDTNDDPQWRKAMNLRRDSILALLQAGATPDYEKNEVDRRLLCIEVEILRDRETPDSDKPLRMQHQLKQLEEGKFINATTNPAEQLTELTVRWLCAPPAESSTQQQLNERFAAATA